MSTHINAKRGDIAEYVLLPGDPLRAKHIAKKFFTKSVEYSNTRGMLGFTGEWNGNRLSVQGMGMGIPSFSIYCNELIDAFGAKRLIRIGTCGTNSEKLKLRDIFIAKSASTDSSMNEDRFGSTFHYAPTPSFNLLYNAYNIAKSMGMNVTVGDAFSSDKFYDDRHEEKMKIMHSLGIVAEEMESVELYTLGALKNVETLALFTVSDDILHGVNTTSEERESGFDGMVKIALETLFS